MVCCRLNRRTESMAKKLYVRGDVPEIVVWAVVWLLW